MRIVIVSSPFPPQVVGGAEIVAARQARRLAKRGHEVAIFAAAFGEGAPRPGTLQLEDMDGLRIWRFGVEMTDPAACFTAPGAALRLAAVLQHERAEVVHLHNVGRLGYDLFAVAAATGARVVATLHDPWGICLQQTLLRPDGALCDDTEACAVCRPLAAAPGGPVPQRVRRDTVLASLLAADRFVVPGAALGATYVAAGLPAERLSVVSNGIDLDAFPVTERTEPAAAAFLFVGYLGEHKGLPDLVEAATLLAARGAAVPPWTLTIAGTGHLDSWLEQTVAARKLGRHVRILGRLDRAGVVAALRGATALVMPSRWPENEPVVLLEAIAAGIAQIATDVGGNPALVEAGRTGLLVPRADPVALAAAMARLAEDRATARAMGARNLARREGFSDYKAVEALEVLYRAPLSAKAPLSPVVICGGNTPEAAVAEALARFHLTEAPQRRIRFVWHAWADERCWNAAVATWVWSAEDPGEVATEALRRGLPLIGPAAACWVASLAGSFGAVTPCQTAETALQAVADIAGRPKQRGTAELRLAAAWRTATAPRSAFALSVANT